MKKVECRTIAEFDACVAAGNTAVIFNLRVEARDDSSVVARDNSSVEAWDNSSVEAWDNSSVVARDNSSVVARDNSSVEAWGSVFVRLFSALIVRASTHVLVMVHGTDMDIVHGGVKVRSAPEPVTGAEWCEYYGVRADAPYVVKNIDAAILSAIENERSVGLDMGSWHGQPCDETNWCKTTHCRAGFAICLAGEAGFGLAKKYGDETAGRMIYAVSRPDKPLPDFHASNTAAMADIRASAEAEKNG